MQEYFQMVLTVCTKLGSGVTCFHRKGMAQPGNFIGRYHSLKMHMGCLSYKATSIIFYIFSFYDRNQLLYKRKVFLLFSLFILLLLDSIKQKSALLSWILWLSMVCKLLSHTSPLLFLATIIKGFIIISVLSKRKLTIKRD